MTSPASSKELSNIQLPAHIRRDPISMALACYASGTDLSGMRIEDRQPFWSEVANAHSLIQKFQPMNVGGLQYVAHFRKFALLLLLTTRIIRNDVPMEIC